MDYNRTMQNKRDASSLSEEQVSNVRHVEGVGWQVLLESSAQWHTCRKEQDACFIASGLRTLDAVTRGELWGKEVAEELEAVAAIAARVLGGAEGDRIMRAAELVRNKTTS
jgi:hypothetical protein